MKNKQPVLLGKSRKLPKSQIRTLLLLGLLVLALPLLALAAKMAVDLNSRAFLPPSAICKEALVKHNFERPCKTTETITKGSQRVISKTRSYSTINFTCIDGYTERYDVKSCMTQDRLLSYAQTVCNQHSIMKDFKVSEGCIIKAPRFNRASKDTASKSSKGFRKTTFTCADGFVTEYSSLCQPEEQLRLYAQKICASHSICPTKPTPTKIPTPTLSVTPTAPVTPTATTSTNVAPTIVTSILPSAIVGQSYNAGVEATDPNSTDLLNMAFSGLPNGLFEGPCAVPSSGGKITCYIYGTPTTAGKYSISVTVKDDKGNTVTKSLLFGVTDGPTPQVSKRTR